MTASSAITAESEAGAGAGRCVRCRRGLRLGRIFAFRPPPKPGGAVVAELLKCVGCAIRHGPMLRRSAKVALVVGTILVALNQGDNLITGNWNGALYWKIPLTYCVPFLVASYGALSNARR